MGQIVVGYKQSDSRRVRKTHIFIIVGNHTQLKWQVSQLSCEYFMLYTIFKSFSSQFSQCNCWNDSKAENRGHMSQALLLFFSATEGLNPMSLWSKQARGIGPGWCPKISCPLFSTLLSFNPLSHRNVSSRWSRHNRSRADLPCPCLIGMNNYIIEILYKWFIAWTFLAKIALFVARAWCGTFEYALGMFVHNHRLSWFSLVGILSTKEQDLLLTYKIIKIPHSSCITLDVTFWNSQR